MASEEGNDRPRSSARSDRETLEYASGARANRAFAWDLASLIAGLLQFPWALFCMLIAWNLGSDALPGHWGARVLLVSMSIPTAVGIFCGYRAMKTHRRSGPNLLGGGGFVLCVLGAVWLLYVVARALIGGAL
jgi:hypothetical protein